LTYIDKPGIIGKPGSSPTISNNLAFHAAAFASICHLQQYKVLGGYVKPLSRFWGLNFAKFAYFCQFYAN
jgi:hypothetical protein